MPRPRYRACLEDGQRLDINKLMRDGTVPRALDGAKAGTLRVAYPTIGFEQEIHFTSRPRHFGGRQFFFQCPATGKRCCILWKPLGATRFCSRQAWGRQVAYRTQYAEPSARCHLAKIKIQRRLSDKEWSDLLPPKPKGMRWKTYERMQARLDRQDEKLEALLLGLWATKWAHLDVFK
jgi:hypothetical protein